MQDAAREATPDSPTGEGGDATVTDGGHEASAADATSEAAEAAGPPSPLEMCIFLDKAWGIDTDAGGCATATLTTCPDRVNGGWAGDINLSFGMDSLECRLVGLTTGFTNQQNVDYSAQVTAWTLAFFGCPQPNDGGALKFGLIPPSQSNHVFTTAELQVISEDYLQAVKDAVANPSTGFTPPALTQAQIDQINAQLKYLADSYGATQSSVDSFSTCAADAGTDVCGDGHAACPTDGGADGG